MNIVHKRWMVTSLGLLVFAGLCACIATGPGYDGGIGVAYVGGYYEPDGRDYGHWGTGYHVAPPRGGERRVVTMPQTHAYRPAPPTRPAPTIPTRPRDRHNP